MRKARRNMGDALERWLSTIMPKPSVHNQKRRLNSIDTLSTFCSGRMCLKFSKMRAITRPEYLKNTSIPLTLINLRFFFGYSPKVRAVVAISEIEQNRRPALFASSPQQLAAGAFLGPSLHTHPRFLQC